MKNYAVSPSKISGCVLAPPSKSHTLRAILFASMANGTSKIHNYLNSPDTKAMLSACEKIGAKIHMSESTLEITGVSGRPKLPDDVINAGNSGQVLRFIAAIAAIIDGYSVFTGDLSVRFNRPIKPLMQALVDLGAECISIKNDDYAPVVIKGPISAGSATLNGSDSQPVSALLMASAFLSGTTKISVLNPGEKPWVALTLSWLDKMGVKYTNKNFEYYTVVGGKAITAFNYNVPGDFSSIAYPIVAAIITKSRVTIHNLDLNDIQGDKRIIDALIQMGANIITTNNVVDVFPCDTLIGCEINVNDMIDALPILAVVACFAEGKTKLINAAIARKKESDRLHAITKELTAMGACIVEENDSLTILGSSLHGANLSSHSDHRIAMSLVIASIAAKSSSIIQNITCITKSYPNFYEDMLSLGASLKELEI